MVDEAGTVIKFCDPNCTAVGQTTYLVTWNGHGDAMALWEVNGDGTLTLANSFTYSSWGAPTTATHNSVADLGFRFLYVGAHDVQWDNFSGLGLHYMHARHYAPAIGRFIQPDPSRQDANMYAYVANGPITDVDPSGLVCMRFECVARVGVVRGAPPRLGPCRCAALGVSKYINVRFGTNSNQWWHATRHLVEKGINVNRVMSHIREHLRQTGHQIRTNTTRGSVINIDGRPTYYAAHRFADGSFRVGRIHLWEKTGSAYVGPK